MRYGRYAALLLLTACGGVASDLDGPLHCMWYQRTQTDTLWGFSPRGPEALGIISQCVTK